MVSKYLERHPDKTLAQARATVKHFLEIPDSVDVGGGLHAANQYFNSNLFMNEADKNNGFSRYMDQLISEMDGNVTHPFPGRRLPHGAASFVAEQLASGALSYVGGEAMGWGLSQLGLGFPDKTEQQQAAIRKQLTDMQSQMSSMQSQLIQLKDQLTALSNEVQEIADRLSAEMKQLNWDLRMSNLKDLLSHISTIKEDLTVFVSNPPPDLVVLDTERTRIMKNIETYLLPYPDKIHLELMDWQGTTSLLKLWSQIVKSHHRYLGSDDSARVQAQVDYFNTAQLWLTELIMEYYHVQASAHEEGSDMFKYYAKKADDAYKKYEEHITAQRAMLLPAIPEGWLLDTKFHSVQGLGNVNMLFEIPIRKFNYPKFVEYRNSRKNYGPIIDDQQIGGEKLFLERAWIGEMFNISSGHPYRYIVGQGWPEEGRGFEKFFKNSAGEVSGSVYYYEDTDNLIRMISLEDAHEQAFHTVATGVECYWVFYTYSVVKDLATGAYRPYAFFW